MVDIGMSMFVNSLLNYAFFEIVLFQVLNTSLTNDNIYRSYLYSRR